MASDPNEVVLVANFGGNTVTVLSATDLSLLADVEVSGNPHGIATAGTKAVVVNAAIQNPQSGDQTGIVDIIDLAQSPPAVEASLPILLTKHSTETSFLYDVAVTPDGDFAFVLITEQSGEQSDGADNGAQGRYDAWSSIHGIDLTASPPRDTGSTGNLGQGTVRILMHPSGKMLLAASVGENQLQWVGWSSDGAPKLMGGRFPAQPFSSYPSSLTFPSDSELVVGLYGADAASDNLFTFAESNGAWSPQGACMAPAYPVALAANSTASVVVALTNTIPRDASGFAQVLVDGGVQAPVPVGVPTAVAISGDATTAFVANAGVTPGEVIPLTISGGTLTAGTPQSVGPNPVALAVGITGSAPVGAVTTEPATGAQDAALPASGPHAEESLVGASPLSPLGVYPYSYGGTCASSGGDPFSGGRSDPISVVWWGPGIMSSSGPTGISQPLADAGFVSTVVPPWGDTGGPAHIVTSANTCIDLALQLAYPTSGHPVSPAFNRYHLRVWPALVDSEGNPTTDGDGNYYFVGTPHKETWWLKAFVFTCTGGSKLGNHAVDAGIPPGASGYDLAREFVAQIFSKGGYVITPDFWGNTMLSKQCTREWVASDGTVVWIYIPLPSSGA